VRTVRTISTAARHVRPRSGAITDAGPISGSCASERSTNRAPSNRTFTFIPGGKRSGSICRSERRRSGITTKRGSSGQRPASNASTLPSEEPGTSICLATRLPSRLLANTFGVVRDCGTNAGHASPVTRHYHKPLPTRRAVRHAVVPRPRDEGCFAERLQCGVAELDVGCWALNVQRWAFGVGRLLTLPKACSSWRSGGRFIGVGHRPDRINLGTGLQTSGRKLQLKLP